MEDVGAEETQEAEGVEMLAGQPDSPELETAANGILPSNAPVEKHESLPDNSLVDAETEETMAVLDSSSLEERDEEAFPPEREVASLYDHVIHYYAETDQFMLDGEALVNQWVDFLGGRYYTTASGTVCRDMFLTVDETGTYYAGATGLLVTGKREIQGDLYYFTEEEHEHGRLVQTNQWVETTEGRIYPRADGKLYRNQFISFGSPRRYYMGADGVQQKGMVQANGTVYRMTGEDGCLLQQSSAYEYNGKWYYAKPDGEPYRNQIITFGKLTYFMGADGARVNGAFTLNGTAYMADVQAGTVTKVFTADFLWPVAGRTSISSPYGPRWGTFHNGIDIPGPLGTPIRCALDGVVVDRGYSASSGNYIVVRHENGYYTKYYHLSAFSVKNGQRVTMGQQLGAMGSTGHSTGSHLHFEVRSGSIYGNRYDPQSFTYEY